VGKAVVPETFPPAAVAGVPAEELLPVVGVVHPADTTSRIVTMIDPINTKVFFIHHLVASRPYLKLFRNLSYDGMGEQGSCRLPSGTIFVNSSAQRSDRPCVKTLKKITFWLS
jgi:hypothetical protein